MLVLGLCLFFTRLVGHRFGRRSSCRRSLIRCCRRSSVVLPLVVAVGRCRWSSCRPSSGRLSVVGRRSLSSSVSRWSSVVLSVVRHLSSVSLPGPSASELSRDSLPNSLPPRSPRLSSSASRATHCQPAFLLSASVDSSDKPFGVSRPRLPSVSASWLPLVGFRLWVRFARPLPLLVFEAPFSSLAFPRLLEIAWFRPVLVASPVSADLSRACPAPFPPVAWPPPRVSFFTSSAPRVRFRAPFWVLSGSLLGPFWVPSGSLLGPFWGRLSWPPSHTSPVGQSTLAVSRLFMTCRGSGPIHTSRDRAPPSLPRLRGFSPHFVRAPPSLLFTSCTSFLSPILSLP